MAAGGTTVPGTTIRYINSGSVVGEWVQAPHTHQAGRAIYYLHGSGYAVCSARTHRGLASRLSQTTGLPVFVLDYRLAPEHVFPAAADDVADGYRWLLDQGFAPGDLFLAGDSAGGHLAVDLLLNSFPDPHDHPAAMALFSPLIDPTLRLAKARESTHGRDPMISADGARRLLNLYAPHGQLDSSHPRLSLNFESAGTLPPTLVQVGGNEMLSADATYLSDKINADGGSCTLEIWPGLLHVFQALDRIYPEADTALRRVNAFLSTVVANAAEQQGESQCSG